MESLQIVAFYKSLFMDAYMRRRIENIVFQNKGCAYTLMYIVISHHTHIF